VTYQKEESSHTEELRRQHELQLQERQRLEMMISQESKVSKGQVAKRSDDVHGLGWGNVTTGFVSRKKLGFLQQHAASVERDWSVEGSPGPAATGRGLRVTWADSPGSSRPDSRLQDIDTLRAQTPPLAGEWAAERAGSGNIVTAHQSASRQFSSSQQSSSSSYQASQSQAFSSSKQMSSSSAFSSSSQKASFSQSTSSSFQSSSIEASKAFEAFPGMNTIDNLKLEQ